MQLGGLPGRGPTPMDVPAALREAQARLGHRPAVTVLSARGREEQGVASLAQWAAKGAHLLEVDLFVEPGDAVHLDAPLSWTTAAVGLAVWWTGAAVRLGAGPAVASVVHESRPAPADAGDVLLLGDAIDGAPQAADGEAWVRMVQTFPDQPPIARGTADATALVQGDRRWTQAELLGLAADLDEGTLGLDAEVVDPVIGLVDVALRPLVVGRPTVVLQGVDRSAAAGEQVAVWR